jgi:hypothetical protein
MLSAARLGIDLDLTSPYAQELLVGKHLPGRHDQSTHGGGGGNRDATLSDRYQQVYGDISDEWSVGDNLTVVLTQRGEAHVANDEGPGDREVLFDLVDSDEARQLAGALDTMADDWDDLLEGEE